MKLRSKLSLFSLGVNVVFLFIAALSLYFIVRTAVFNELDEHLENHKQDLIQRFENNELTLDTIDQIGSIGTYEWIELRPLADSGSRFSDEYTTVSKTRFAGAESAQYRQLRTIIPIEGKPYILIIYEEIAGWETIAFSIIGGTLVLLLIWFVMIFFGNELIIKNTLHPFFSTISALRSIRSERDFDITFPEVNTEELNELNETLNNMLEELEVSFKKQKQFIQNASHELLTPLSIIRHKTDELLNDDSLNEQTMVEISKIQQTIIRLKKLASALLTISRMESNHYSVDEHIDAEALIREAANELSVFIQSKNIDLKYELPAIPNFKGNAELFCSLIYNVLQNSVYHTAENTTILVKAEVSDHQLDLTISDSGPGIPDEETERVFERFERSSENGGTGNHGLGLAIVRSICTLHGWHCFFERGREQGAAFHVTIPLPT